MVSAASTNRAWQFFLLIIPILLLHCYAACAQSNLVRNRLKMVAMGEADKVRMELPDLLADFPNDPGVRFLHAVLVDDAVRALPLYERIVEDYGNSEWADDAQWRIVQIYALKRDTEKARAALEAFRKNFPDSEYLLFAVETVKETVGLSGNTPLRPAKSNPESTGTPKTNTTTHNPSAGTQKSAATAKSANGQEKEKDQPAASLGSATRYTLQVGLYSTRESAEAEKERFTQFRMRATIIEKTIESLTKYAVTIGDYSTRESADRARQTVQQYCNCTPFVVAKDSN